MFSKAGYLQEIDLASNWLVENSRPFTDSIFMRAERKLGNCTQETQREVRRQRKQWKAMSPTSTLSRCFTGLPKGEGKTLGQDLVLLRPLRKGKGVGGPMRPFAVMFHSAASFAPGLYSSRQCQRRLGSQPDPILILSLLPELHKPQPKGTCYIHSIRLGNVLFSLCSSLHCLSCRANSSSYPDTNSQ